MAKAAESDAEKFRAAVKRLGHSLKMDHMNFQEKKNDPFSPTTFSAAYEAYKIEHEAELNENKQKTGPMKWMWHNKDLIHHISHVCAFSPVHFKKTRLYLHTCLRNQVNGTHGSVSTLNSYENET